MKVTKLVPDPAFPTASATLAASIDIVTVSPDKQAGPDIKRSTTLFIKPVRLKDLLVQVPLRVKSAKVTVAGLNFH